QGSAGGEEPFHHAGSGGFRLRGGSLPGGRTAGGSVSGEAGESGRTGHHCQRAAEKRGQKFRASGTERHCPSTSLGVTDFWSVSGCAGGGGSGGSLSQHAVMDGEQGQLQAIRNAD